MLKKSLPGEKENKTGRRRLILYLAYVLLVGLPLLGIFFIVVRSFAATPVRLATSSASPAFSIFTFIVELVVIISLARLTGALFRYIGQPPVVGEMLAGILLGPSGLGALAPTLSAAVFPPSALPFLNTVSQLGLVIFMFLVGLRLDLKELRKSAPAALLVSHVSIAIPLFLGVVLAGQLYLKQAPANVSFPAFALFMGVAMSITAFPVLARILADRNLLGSPVGTLATACAAIDDVTGWTMLAIVVALVRGPSAGTPLWLTLLDQLSSQRS